MWLKIFRFHLLIVIRLHGVNWPYAQTFHIRIRPISTISPPTMSNEVTVVEQLFSGLLPGKVVISRFKDTALLFLNIMELIIIDLS